MKRFGRELFLLSVVLCLVAAATVARGASELYIGVLGGYVMPDDLEVTYDGGGDVADIALDDGWLAGAKLGYIPASMKYVAVEVEYDYSTSDYDTGEVCTDQWGTYRYTDGTTTTQGLFLNVLLRYPRGKLHPYIGAGPGYFWVKHEDVATSGGWTGDSEKASEWGYQVIAGLDYDLDRDWSIGIGYKYAAVEPSFGGEFESDIDTTVQVVTLGLTCSF